MRRDEQAFVYVGIKGCVVAIDRDSGDSICRADLRSAEYVTVFWDGQGSSRRTAVKCGGSTPRPATPSGETS